jgi:hypothetical protein
VAWNPNSAGNPLVFITQAPHLKQRLSDSNCTKFILFYLQARVIHNTSSEWQQIKEATEKAREAAASSGSDEVGEVTCFELLEALELSRCLFLMRYGSNLILI